jgi:hypothetical protein
LLDHLKILERMRLKPGNILVTNFTQWPRYITISLYLLKVLQRNNPKNRILYINWISNIYPVHISAWIPQNFTSILKNSLMKPIESFLCTNNKVEKILFSKKSLEYPAMELYNSTPSIEWIKNLSVDGFKIGDSILSTYSKIYGVESNQSWDLKFIQDLLNTYNNIYTQILENISTNQINYIFIFNGRYIYEAAALNAARKSGVKVIFYESGGILKDFDIYTHDTHDSNEIQLRMSNLFHEYPKNDLIKWGKDWFESQSQTSLIIKIISLIYFEIRFIRHKQKKKIIYYASSDDELSWIGDDWKSSLGTQKECIEMLEEICKANDIILVVKLHPNLLSKSTTDKRYWLNFFKNRKSVILIKPNKILNSYILMKYSNLIVNYNSTIGIEASYRGKVAVCLAPTFYSSFRATIDCETREELESVIELYKSNKLRISSPAMPKYIYGAFMNLRGSKIKSFNLYSDSYVVYENLEFGIKNPLIRLYIFLCYKYGKSKQNNFNCHS